jgi:hypothetical protein
MLLVASYPFLLLRPNPSSEESELANVVLGSLNPISKHAVNNFTIYIPTDVGMLSVKLT